MWPFKRSRSSQGDPTAEPEVVEDDRSPEWSTHDQSRKRQRAVLAAVDAAAVKALSDPYSAPDPGMATDAAESSVGVKAALVGVPEQVLSWYASTSFIGYQACAMIAQHWLVDKACTMPARDAIRNGFDLQVYGRDQLTADRASEIVEEIKRGDRRFHLAKHMQEYIRMGRIFGIRIAVFKVKSDDPGYYEKPFNPDGVTPGSYEGIVQVDPYWCNPMLSSESATEAVSDHFYDPEWWIIQGRKYHRSHLCIYRCGEVPDILKPAYRYGGVSVPQRVYERVYGAERTANEAPQLAMTKRLNVLKTDLAAMWANEEWAIRHQENFAYYRDNFGVKLVDSDDEMQVFDVTLADLDTVIMTQYQIVAAAAETPATKLLGTSPKGFNATGEFEADSYHEMLESIQANDLTEFVDRHHVLLMRSEVGPDLGLDAPSVRVEVDWLPVGTQSAKEYAETNYINAQTDDILARNGAVDGIDMRGRLRGDRNSGYADLPEDKADDDEAPQDPAI